MSDDPTPTPATYGRQHMLAALRLLGQKLEAETGTPTELSLVGGAAGMLTCEFDWNIVTRDCDVMTCAPDRLQFKIETLAWEVGRELGMDEHWLNFDTQMTADNLPEGWETRRIWVNTFGILTIQAASRLDLIAMKTVAARSRDLEHLLMMKPEPHELAFARQHIEVVRRRNPAREAALQDGLLLIAGLEAEYGTH